MAKRDVLCEIQSVLDVLRRNDRFAEPTERSQHAAESFLTTDLKALRKSTREWESEDLSGFSRLELVLPFLAVVRSREANGVLTDAALRSIQAFLGKRLIEEGSVQASEAAGEVVDALIGCQFEETQQGHDEAVRARIMQVMVGCLEGGAGTSLPDEVVWEVLQTCMANLDQMSAHSQLLRMAAEDGVFKVVRWIFLRLPAAGRIEASQAAASPPPPPPPPPPLPPPQANLSLDSNALPPSGGVSHSFRKEAPQQEGAEDRQLHQQQQQHQHASEPTRLATAGGGNSRSEGPTLLPKKADGPETVSPSHGHAGAAGGCGLPCVVKVFGFLCSQLVRKGGGGGAGSSRAGGGVGAGGSGPTPRRILCLRLMRTALTAAGGNLARYPPILEMVRDDLCFALLHLMQESGGTNVVGEVLSIVRYLWGSLRLHLKVQLELLFGAIFLRALSQLKREGDEDLRRSKEEAEEDEEEEGEGEDDGARAGGWRSPTQRREQPAVHAADADAQGVRRVFRDRELEMALECLCDFMWEPTFLVEVYVNYDCDVHRSNLTVLLVSALADVAYGAPSRLPSAKASCLAALSAALHHLHARCTTAVPGVDAIPSQKSDSASTAAAAAAAAAMAVSPGATTASSAAAAAAPEATAAVCAGLPSPSACRQARTRKLARAVAAAKFLAKPREGLKLLQLEGVFGQRLDAEEVARFLRSTPSLDKAAVGAYLGEAGAKRGTGGGGAHTKRKSVNGGGCGASAAAGGCSASASEDDVISGRAGSGPRGAEEGVGGGDGRAEEERGAGGAYQGDTVEFHAEVLEAFVETFDFRDQGILASLRMFLEAFRLPGEAQQIDRILHSFSQRIHRDCLEAARGMLASADVAYLLSFSVIMLNTDLHNPNIRPEKRMSCNAFIQNNKNYGGDISGGHDLPRDFLESVYASVKDQPIVTFGGGPAAPVTANGWQDLLRRHRSTNTLAVYRGSSAIGAALWGGQRSGMGGLEEHDRDLLSACWPAVLKAASAAFVARHGQDASALGASVDLFLLLAKLCGHHYGLQVAFDKVLLLLCRFTGLIEQGRSQSRPSTRGNVSAEGGSAEGTNGVTATRFVDETPAARTAAVTAFGIAHRLGDHMREGWVPLLQLIFAMRDLRILPQEALAESGEDLLQPRERDAFNSSVLSGGFKAAAVAAARRRRSAAAAETPTDPELAARVSERDSEHGGGGGGGGGGASLLAWVLGRPTAESAAEAEERPPLDASPTTGRRVSALAGTRVEGGVEGAHDEGEQQPAELWNETAEGRVGGGGLSEYTDGASSDDDNDDCSSAAGSDSGGNRDGGGDGGAARADGGWVSQARVQDLLGESRRLDADSLRALLGALIATVHGSLPLHERQRRDFEERSGVMGSGEGKGSSGGGGGGGAVAEAAGGFCEAFEGFEGFHPHQRIVQIQSISAASLAYAEVLIAEIALRNRERITLVLPLLLEHYRRRLSGATYATFSVEKAATGLLRILSRLFFRPGLAAPLSRTLPWLIPPHLNSWLFESVAGHVSSAMRRLVATAPAGGGDGGQGAVGAGAWRAVISVLEACASVSGGGRAEADAFEAVCLLVHNQDLKELLPVESVTACVSAFFVDCRRQSFEKSFDGGGGSGSSSSHGGGNACLFARAALDLLMVLHARLPCSFKGKRNRVRPREPVGDSAAGRGLEADSAGAGVGGAGGVCDTGGAGTRLLPVDAWMVILRALCLGARSAEQPVATHALQLLTKVVLDDLAEEAPADVLQDVMLTIVFPLARHTWDMAAVGEEPMRRWNHHEEPCSSSTQPAHRPSQAALATSSPPPQNGRQGVASTRRRHHAEHGGGGGGGPSTAAQLEAAQQAKEGEEGEDGFEMIEAPDEAGHSPHADATAAAPALSREPSGGRGGGEGVREAEGTENGDDDDDDDDSDDEVGLQQLSSPALLALLLVLKSFLKHLSSLRRGEQFCDVWREFLGCVEILLGTVGTAPPTLVDGAAAGLGAVLGEMHGEGLFAAAFSAESQESGTRSRCTDTHRTLWAHTHAKVPQFACCPDLLRLVVEEGGEGSGPRPVLEDR